MTHVRPKDHSRQSVLLLYLGIWQIKQMNRNTLAAEAQPNRPTSEAAPKARPTGRAERKQQRYDYKNRPPAMTRVRPKDHSRQSQGPK